MSSFQVILLCGNHSRLFCYAETIIPGYFVMRKPPFAETILSGYPFMRKPFQIILLCGNHHSRFFLLCGNYHSRLFCFAETIPYYFVMQTIIPDFFCYAETIYHSRLFCYAETIQDYFVMRKPSFQIFLLCGNHQFRLF